MIDMFGNTVNVGDKIVYSKPISTNSGFGNSKGRSPLVTGIVERLRENSTVAVVCAKDENGHSKTLHLKSHTILLYPWNKEVR